jgi:hypothetical protein
LGIVYHILSLNEYITDGSWERKWKLEHMKTDKLTSKICDPFPKRSDSLDYVERYWLMLVITNIILTSLTCGDSLCWGSAFKNVTNIHIKLKLRSLDRIFVW